MMQLRRTDATHKDFIQLVKDLDAYLKTVDGDDHAFYAQYNTLEYIQHVIIAYENDLPVGCGAIKAYNPDAVEVKRMFTLPEVRGKGVASTILTALENWANELGYTKCILETGKKQVEAIGLYQKKNYHIVPNYGPYNGVENSICFEKSLNT